MAYHEKDVRDSGSPIKCGVDALKQQARSLLDQSAGAASVAPELNRSLPPGVTRELEVATDTDFEFWDFYNWRYNDPNSAFHAVERFLNAVDGIYRDQLQMTIRHTFSHAWQSRNNGYPYHSDDAYVLLYDFAAYWNDSSHTLMYNARRDVAHLFVGKYMQDGVQGIASNKPKTCTESAYSLTSFKQDIGYLSEGLITKVVAHEIGHNLSAQHDDVVYGIYCGSIGPDHVFAGSDLRPVLFLAGVQERHPRSRGTQAMSRAAARGRVQERLRLRLQR